MEKLFARGEAGDRDQGLWLRPSEYGDGSPYPLTRKLIEEGRNHLVLGSAIDLGCPVRILQGAQDPDVPWQHAFALTHRLPADDVVLTMIRTVTTACHARRTSRAFSPRWRRSGETVSKPDGVIIRLVRLTLYGVSVTASTDWPSAFAAPVPPPLRCRSGLVRHRASIRRSRRRRWRGDSPPQTRSSSSPAAGADRSSRRC